jgi:hypothetical protein
MTPCRVRSSAQHQVSANDFGALYTQNCALNEVAKIILVLSSVLGFALIQAAVTRTCNEKYFVAYI